MIRHPGPGARGLGLSVLVVVGGMADVAMLAMDEVDVVLVDHGGMPALGGMHVHMAAVGHMTGLITVLHIVHVVVVGMVDVTVVQEVEVIAVLDGRVTAEPVVDVVVPVVKLVLHATSLGADRETPPRRGPFRISRTARPRGRPLSACLRGPQAA